MAKKTLNFRLALEQMLEYIKNRRICIGEAMFVLSDEVLLKNKLIVSTLEEAGCIQLLGRLNHRTGARFRSAYGSDFVSQIYPRATQRGVKCPWGHKVWAVNAVRSDQVNPQLLLTRPLLEKIKKQYGHDPQIRAVGEDETKLDDEPWRLVPE